MKRVEDYTISDTKRMIVKHMLQTYEMSEQECLDSLKSIVWRIKEVFPQLSVKEFL